MSQNITVLTVVPFDPTQDDHLDELLEKTATLMSQVSTLGQTVSEMLEQEKLRFTESRTMSERKKNRSIKSQTSSCSCRSSGSGGFKSRKPPIIDITNDASVSYDEFSRGVVAESSKTDTQPEKFVCCKCKKLELQRDEPQIDPKTQQLETEDPTETEMKTVEMASKIDEESTGDAPKAAVAFKGDSAVDAGDSGISGADPNCLVMEKDETGATVLRCGCGKVKDQQANSESTVKATTKLS